MKKEWPRRSRPPCSAPRRVHHPPVGTRRARRRTPTCLTSTTTTSRALLSPTWTRWRVRSTPCCDAAWPPSGDASSDERLRSDKMPSTAFPASTAGPSRAGGLTLPKAQIINIDRGGEIIECMFNPKEYSMAKKNNWGAPKSGGGAGSNTGTNLPRQQYSGGQPATLTMQLFFDTYAG